MKNIKRMFASITAQFSTFVDHIENHEAIAESALRQFNKDIREAKVQLKFLERERNQADKKVQMAESEIQKWKNRAKVYADEDREKALECVKRLKANEAEKVFWENKSAELSQLQTDLQRQLRSIEAKYQDMKIQFQKYLTREKTSELAESLSHCSQYSEPIENVFERWEKRIIRQEVGQDFNHFEVDELADEFDQADQKLDLEATLNELKNEEN